MTRLQTQGSGRATTALLLALPLALAPVIRELLPAFQTVAGMRGLVSMLEFGFIGAWLLRGPHNALPERTRAANALFVAWATLATLAVIGADYRAPALVRHAEWAGHLLFGLALWQGLSRRPGLAGVVFASITAGFLLATAGLLAHWAAFPDPVAHDWALELPFFDHVRHYGYLALAALLCCTYWLARPRPAPAVAAGLAFVVALAALLWTGGRGAALGAAVGIGLVMLHAAGPVRLRLGLITLAALVPAAWLAGLFRVDIPIMGIDRLLGRAVEYGDMNEFATGRGELWQYTLAAIAEHPWLGLGPDGFAYLSPPVMRLPVQPHSFALQIVSDWGLPAALAFAGLGLIAALAWWRGVRAGDPADATRTARMTAGALVGAFGAHGIVDGTFYHALPLAIAAACTAIALAPRPPAADSGGQHGRRTAIVAGTLFGAVVLVGSLHVAVVAIVTGRTVPAPDSWRATLIQGFPTRINQRTLRPWLSEWETFDPARALELARWAQHHARHPWWYHYYEAIRVADTDRAAAELAFDRAIAHAPRTEVARLRAEFDRRFGKPPTTDRR